jgi:hypothetical protein
MSQSSFSALLMSTIVMAGCGSLEMTSRWRDRDVVIDGHNSTWFSPAVALKDDRASVVLFNDSEYVYVGLRTSNRDLQRLITRDGITWWFDRDGGETKQFGIRYPVGGPRPPADKSEQPPGEQEPPTPESAENSNELDVYVSGAEQPQRMTTVGSGGINVNIHHSRDTLFYELRVPLADNRRHPFAIGTKAGAMIGIGLETVVRGPREGPPEGGHGNPRPSDRSTGSPGSHGSGRGLDGGQMGRQASSPDPIKGWVKVQLAGDTTHRAL